VEALKDACGLIPTVAFFFYIIAPKEQRVPPTPDFHIRGLNGVEKSNTHVAIFNNLVAILQN
jgi:hypothetical protein